MDEKFLVTEIQRFSVNDGPGIRTTVFLKGCPLRCAWCHNPECINLYNEVFHKTEKCVKCGACVEICPEGAIAPPRKVPKKEKDPPENQSNCSVQSPENIPEKEEDIVEIEPPVIDREKCTHCLQCVDACQYGAITRVGTPLTLQDVLKIVKSDDIFYESSGGGATISGGEPLFQPDITLALLKSFKDAGISTAIDTTGFAKWEVLEQILEYVDVVLFDIKSLDDEKHIKWTGVSNALILENVRKIAKKGVEMRLRLPIIHDVNYWDLQFPRAVVEFARELGKCVSGIDILPFHVLAEAKNEQLGRENIFKGFSNLFPGDIEEYESIIRNGGAWQVTVGGMVGVQKNK